MNLNNLKRFGVEVEFLASLNASEVIRAIKAEYKSQTGMTLRLLKASYSDKSNEWRIKPDVSVGGSGLYGHELVTPILEGEDDLAKLLKVVAIIKTIGGTTNKSCGIHVHVDLGRVNGSGNARTSINRKQMKMLMKMIAKFEGAMNTLIPASRRGRARWCQDAFEAGTPLSAIWDTLKIERLTNTQDLIDSFSSRASGNKYMKWSFAPYWRHKTVECRAHSGSLDVAKIENWVRLIQAIVDYAIESRYILFADGATNKTYTHKDLLRSLLQRGSIDAATSRFYHKRFKTLNPEFVMEDGVEMTWNGEARA